MANNQIERIVNSIQDWFTTGKGNKDGVSEANEHGRDPAGLQKDNEKKQIYFKTNLNSLLIQ